MAQQQLSVITLAVADLARSRQFYDTGFGWTPCFTQDGIAFYQMNGFVLGLWQGDALAGDFLRPLGAASAGAFALAHNVAERTMVETVMAGLLAAGGTLMRAADAPPHGGYRGYVADPDGHAWEIAWNPAWSIDVEGHIRFGL